MTTIEGRIEGEEWETIIPSSLTVVQARSVMLDEGGLPCCEADASELAALNLDEDSTVLTRSTETNP
jgi:hypothetical protein